MSDNQNGLPSGLTAQFSPNDLVRLLDNFITEKDCVRLGTKNHEAVIYNHRGRRLKVYPALLITEVSGEGEQ